MDIFYWSGVAFKRQDMRIAVIATTKAWITVSCALAFMSCRGEKHMEGVSFEEKLLATIPADVVIVSNDDVVFSPDGRSVAYSAERDHRGLVIVNDARGPEFDWAAKPVFSPDGRKVAYVGVTNIDWKRWLDPTVPNFEHGGKWFVVDNGKQTGPYDYAWLVSYSPDGNRTAFAAMAGNKWSVVNGDHLGEQFDGVGVPMFSRDGRLAYAAHSGNQHLIVVETTKGPEYDEVGDPLWSPDGSKLAYAARKGKEWTAVVDSQEVGTFDLVTSLDFRKDGVLAFVGYRNGKASVVVGTKKEESFDDVMGVVFSEEGSAMAYEAKKENKWFVVSRLKRSKPAFSITGIGLDKTGQRLAFGTYDGKYHVVLDRETIQETSDMPMRLQFSPDGKNLVYILVGDESKSVGINGTSSRPFDDVRTLVFSPDSKKIAFGARSGNELWWRVLEVPAK